MNVKREFVDSIECEFSISGPTYYYSNIRCAVLTHPYGPLGGQMHNNVLDHLFGWFSKELGISVCRFNFRGVGNSGGHLSLRGTGEEQDLETIMNYMSESNGISKFIICGYSYGSLISSSCINSNVIGFISISFPYSVSWFLTLFNSNRFLSPLYRSTVPKFFLFGEHDQFTSTENFEYLVSNLKNCESAIIAGCDHFWVSRESEISQTLKPFVLKLLE